MSDGVATDVVAEPDLSHDVATDDATSRDTSHDVATSETPLSRHVADTERERFTLTVEDVAVRLADENVYRNPRTIQRWCKSGKLDSLLDAANGERYLVEPTSLEQLVATLVRDRDRQSRDRTRQEGDVSRQIPRQDATDPDNTATLRDTSPVEPEERRDTVAPERPSSDEDTALHTRIQQLESELALAKADKQVREQMVEYLKDQFAQMLDGALDRSEQIGELRAENAQLKNLLNTAPSSSGDNAPS